LESGEEVRSSDLYKVVKELMPGGVSSPGRAFEPNPIYIKERTNSGWVQTEKKRLKSG
jgi:glutamate-1-semialdehyde aminotransferase